MINGVFSYIMHSQITRAMATAITPAARVPNNATMTEEFSSMVSEISHYTIQFSYRTGIGNEQHCLIKK